MSEQKILDQRKHAMLIDFSKLPSLIIKDLNKNDTSSSLFKKYNKEDVRKFLENPQNYQNQLRDISRFIYTYSPHYKRLVKYFSGGLTFDYIIEPYGIDEKTNLKVLKANYIKTSNYLDVLNFKHEFKKISKIIFKEDTFYGYEHQTDNSYYIQRLDSKYCQISSIEDGVYNFAFDFSFFDGRNNDKLKQYPTEFSTKYNQYKSDKTKRWIELDSERTICIKVNEEYEYPIPPFAGTFEDIFDIVDYKSLRKAKEEVGNYKVLVQEIPMKKDSDHVNDFMIDLNTVMMFHNKAAESLPDQVGLITTPMKVTDFGFEKDKVGSDSVSESERDYWNGAGVSQLLFNSDKGGSIGLNRSIQSDETIMFDVLRQFERWVNRKLKYIGGFASKFKVKFLNMTRYNEKELQDQYLKSAQFGMPVKTLLAASHGMSPSEMVNMITLENDVLGLHDRLIPLKSSHTASSSDGGRPQSNEDDLSDSGGKTRDGDANANRAK